MRAFILSLGVSAVVACGAGCGSAASTFSDNAVTTPPFDAGTDGSAVPTYGGGGAAPPLTPAIVGNIFGDASLDAPATALTAAEPQTCDEAAQEGSYIGCDYWPTVVANNVWSIFDFAVVVANAGPTTASVTVTGPGGTNQTASVPPGQLEKLYLPWVPALKGPDADNCGASMPLTASVVAPASAYHLVSTVPVTVYQFNALEYQGRGGPPGKNWSSCPGDTVCEQSVVPAPVGCFSFSNDASLLLPSTAMTGNYRITGHEGVVITAPNGQSGPSGGYVAITATQDNTTVRMQVSSTGQVSGGGAVPATAAGGMLTLTLNRGDVAELLGPGGSDLSGSLVQASAPVQVIAGHPCIQIPPTEPACDHIEESVFPAETLGKDYVVTRPTGPAGTAVGHQVRIYGNVDGTHLTYSPATPPGCPTTINAGQVVECGTPACPTTISAAAPMTECGITNQDFEVIGDQPFAVGTFTLGAFVVDPAAMINGDPAASFPASVEQFRSKYVFLAPDDYTSNFVDVVANPGAVLTLDGQTVNVAGQAVGGGGYDVYRVALGAGQAGQAGQAGAHVLSATAPVGIQVVGYGSYTSYMYPGGLDLVHIAPPPPPLL